MTSSEPKRVTVDGPLDAVNDSFHGAYDAARAVVEREPPILVVIADTLVLFCGSMREALPFAPRLFHLIKSVAHAPLGPFALLHAGGGALDPSAKKRMGALREHLSRSLAQLPDDALHPELERDLRTVLDASLALCERALAARQLGDDEREAFARTLGPLLLRLTDAATRVQLSALHEAVQTLVAPLDADERRTLQVVVTGDHQARVRSLAMQYFRKLLREPEGSEERVTYAEGVSGEAEARALVGTRKLDRAVASAFFSDPHRLQRDILGDAVLVQLRGLSLPPLV